jgi:steroid delta-isomerase-like uncharacterized protein
MSTETNKAIATKMLAAVDAGNLDVAVQYLAPDFQAHLQGNPQPFDRDGWRQFGEMFRAGFSNSRHEILDIIAEGDRVVTRTRWQATHQDTFQGVPPTGKQVTLDSVMIARVVGDQIAEHWVTVDMTGFMQQLGAAQSVAA